jgi:hypothetical protein
MRALRQRLEESLFRYAERAEHEPAVRARVKAVVRAGMRAAIVEKERTGSDRLYRQLRALALRWARWRAPRLARRFAIDPERMDQLAAVQDWEDRVLDVTGHWPVREATVAVKHETACPYADLAARDPRICTDIVHALETETFRAIQPRYHLVPLDRLLSRGDTHCVFRHELLPPRDAR